MKRRSFISKSAALTFGASLFPTFNIISRPQKDGLGIALVGLGNYATNQLAPALQQTKGCHLAGIVTGTPSKVAEWSEKYQIPDSNIYSYNNYDDIVRNKNIDAVYIVLPNNMHAEYVIRGVEAGKHAITEKPMATTFADCQAMIRAAKKADKKLAVGYRLHYDPFNLEVMRLGQKKIFGDVEEINAGFGFTLTDKKRWRLSKEMAGGGPLMDVGIYAMQGVIYTLGLLPTSVMATDTTKDPGFYGAVEGSLEWQFSFPGGVQNSLATTYETYYQYLNATCKSGSFELGPAYVYDGLAGKTSKGPMDFPPVNQQARHMDDFADCVRTNRQSMVRGEMGARDMFIIEKIYESAALHKEVSLKGIPNILHRL